MHTASGCSPPRHVQNGPDCTGYAFCHVDFFLVWVLPTIGIFRPGLPQSKDRDSLRQRLWNHGSNWVCRLYYPTYPFLRSNHHSRFENITIPLRDDVPRGKWIPFVLWWLVVLIWTLVSADGKTPEFGLYVNKHSAPSRNTGMIECLMLIRASQ